MFKIVDQQWMYGVLTELVGLEGRSKKESV